MAIQIRKAERRKAKLRLALVGPTGSGKTYSALQLAFGIGGKVGMIDTEHGSGDLYANLGDYDVISLEPPYTVTRYREAIRAFEEAGYDTIIIDSLSHAWAGVGGLLDKQGQLEKSDRFKNSFATWREITPEHNRLVEELLGSPCHIIATMRAKTEYVIEKDEKGRQVPRKIGLSPVQRDGVEYEFTVVMDVNESHYASASKDRTSTLDGWSDKISRETGVKLKAWLETGTDAPALKFPEWRQHEVPSARIEETLSPNASITKAQADDLIELLDKNSIEKERFCSRFGIGGVAELPAGKFASAKIAIARTAEGRRRRAAEVANAAKAVAEHEGARA